MANNAYIIARENEILNAIECVHSARAVLLEECRRNSPVAAVDAGCDDANSDCWGTLAYNAERLETACRYLANEIALARLGAMPTV